MEAKTVKNLVLSGIMLVLSVSLVSSTFKVIQRSRRLIEVKNELAQLQEQKTQLEKEAQYRKSPEFIEEEARNKLNMVKPGEEVYLKPKISGDDLLGAQTEARERKDAVKRPFPLKGLFDKIKETLLLFQS